jgi:hypothetical protein
VTGVQTCALPISSFVYFLDVKVSDENYTEIHLFQGATYPRWAS